MIRSRLFIPLIILWSVQFLGPLVAHAQDPLYLVNAETTVRKISFKFPEHDVTFEPEQLLEQLVTTAPSFWDRFNRLNPFKKSQTYPFDPIELQKDVVRLRQFYHRNGFPSPRISYSASQFDAETNRIRVIFAIWEGEPLFIQHIDLAGADSLDLEREIPSSLHRQWRRFDESVSESVKQRYTEIEQLRIQDLILKWFQNNGYAFAWVDVSADIDNENRTADLHFAIRPGPIGYFSEIEVEGHETVSNQD